MSLDLQPQFGGRLCVSSISGPAARLWFYQQMSVKLHQLQLPEEQAALSRTGRLEEEGAWEGRGEEKEKSVKNRCWKR